MLAAWSLLKRKKQTFNEQKMLPRFFLINFMKKKKTKQSNHFSITYKTELF